MTPTTAATAAATSTATVAAATVAAASVASAASGIALHGYCVCSLPGCVGAGPARQRVVVVRLGGVLRPPPRRRRVSAVRSLRGPRWPAAALPLPQVRFPSVPCYARSLDAVQDRVGCVLRVCLVCVFGPFVELTCCIASPCHGR